MEQCREHLEGLFRQPDSKTVLTQLGCPEVDLEGGEANDAWSGRSCGHTRSSKLKDSRLTVCGTSVTKWRVFRVLAGYVDSIPEVGPRARWFRLSKQSQKSQKPDVVNTPNEERLIQAAQDGNLKAFQQLVHGFDRQMLHLALRITGLEQAARSIYCETMLKL
jgi:hypothetical protein